MTDAAAMAWSRPDNRVWAAGWTLAIALHGAVVAAWLIECRTEPLPLPPPAPLVIEMVTLPAEPLPELVPPPPAPVAEPPPPEIVETPPEVKPAVVIERPKPKPKPKPKRPPRPVEQKPVETPPPPAPVPVAAPPAPAPPAPPSDAVRNARNLWKARLLAHLEHYKRYPLEARRRHEEGVVMLRFRVAPDGRVLASRIERGVDFRALNEAVMDMIARADPVPPPPPELVDGPLEWTVPVDFNLRR